MKYNPDLHHRRSIRLKGYDYSDVGLYFITVCTQNRLCLFGEIVHGEMILNEAGKMVQFTWVDLPQHNINIKLDEFIIMPNHIHGIIIIVGAGSKPALNKRAGLEPVLMKRAGLEPVLMKRAGLEPAPTCHGLSEFVRQFKTFSAKRINKINKTPGIHLWQRNYYEHIIRDENDLNRIREYIANNSLKWEDDKYYELNKGK